MIGGYSSMNAQRGLLKEIGLFHLIGCRNDFLWETLIGCDLKVSHYL
jgi:hypothetical protein